MPTPCYADHTPDALAAGEKRLTKARDILAEALRKARVQLDEAAKFIDLPGDLGSDITDGIDAALLAIGNVLDPISDVFEARAKDTTAADRADYHARVL